MPDVTFRHGSAGQGAGGGVGGGMQGKEQRVEGGSRE